MTGNELVLAMTGTLLAAVLLGWLLRWLYSKMSRAATNDVDTVAELTIGLEEARQAQSNLAMQLAETDQRLTSNLREKEAELEAAMEGLQKSRQNALDWQAAYEALHAQSNVEGDDTTKADDPNA